MLANPTGSCKIPMLGTVRTNREQARSYKHNRGPVNSYYKAMQLSTLLTLFLRVGRADKASKRNCDRIKFVVYTQSSVS